MTEFIFGGEKVHLTVERGFILLNCKDRVYLWDDVSAFVEEQNIVQHLDSETVMRDTGESIEIGCLSESKRSFMRKYKQLNNFIAKWEKSLQK